MTRQQTFNKAYDACIEARRQDAEIVKRLANCSLDCECITCGENGKVPNRACHDHAPWRMTGEDAIDTLTALIRQARAARERQRAAAQHVRDLEEEEKPRA